jgi:hypothetical protein
LAAPRLTSQGGITEGEFLRAESGPALGAAVERGSTELVSLLLDGGIDVNAPTDACQRTALLRVALAPTRNQERMIKLLLDHGAAPLKESCEGELPHLVINAPSRSYDLLIAAKQSIDELVKAEFPIGSTWDDLLPRLNQGTRIDLVRVGPDRFEDVRQMYGHTMRFVFSRTSDGPYKL